MIGDPVAGTSGASNNASHGVQIFVDGFSQLTNPSIQNMTINENGGDGISIERRGLGVIDNFVINANSLNANRGDGFDIQARAGNLLDEYTITNNTIQRQHRSRNRVRVDGDADMSTQLNGNTITNNGGTGITVNSTVNAVTDTPTFTGKLARQHNHRKTVVTVSILTRRTMSFRSVTRPQASRTQSSATTLATVS